MKEIKVLIQEVIQEEIGEIKKCVLLGVKKALTIEECSLYTGLSKSKLYKLTCNNEIPHYKPRGKFVYFDKDEIDDWCLQNKIVTKHEADLLALSYLQKGGSK